MTPPMEEKWCNLQLDGTCLPRKK